MAEDYRWESSHINYTMPAKAIVGGKDSDGSIIYVARSEHSGIKLPAKAIPSKRACYISFNGLEILVERFEVIDCVFIFLLFFREYSTS